MKRAIAGTLFCFLAQVSIGGGDELFRQGAALFNSEPEQAYPLFVQAAEEGNVSAMVGAGHCLENGIGTKIDYTQAIKWYEMAVTQNSVKACEGLARIYASCPDPHFHDGAKAVKYADAVVRKKQKDADALSLLAAAHARNMEFEEALRYAGKAGGYETRPLESAALRQRLEDYKLGRPFPAVATLDWMLEAADRGSRWAIEFVLDKRADRFDPLYDPDNAIRMCQAEIDAGKWPLNLFLGNLYLQQGYLDMAKDCFLNYYENWVDSDREHELPPQVELRRYMDAEAANAIKAADPLKSWRDRITVSGTRLTPKASGGYREVSFQEEYDSMEEVKKAFPNYEKDNSISVNSRRERPSLAGYEFLLRVAALKGNPEAGELLSALDNDLKRSRATIENRDGLDSAAWAAALQEEALKYCNDDEFPVNVALAEACLNKAYELNPSPRTAWILGTLCMRDRVYKMHYRSRHVTEGLRWLSIAHDQGYIPATRRLADFYACDEDPGNCNGELAIQMADPLTSLAGSPSDEYNALFLLTCAYARDGQFTKAEKTFKAAEEVYQKAGWYPSREMDILERHLKDKEPYSHEIWPPCEPMTFRNMVQVLGNA